MGKIKIILLTIIVLVAVFFISALFIWHPIVLDFSDKVDQSNSTHRKGDTIQPLKIFDFDNGEWVAYLFIDNADQENLFKGMPKGNMFKTTDKKLLKQMQKEWIFIYTDGDIATVQSSIIMYNNGKKVFDSGIVLNESIQGLQSSQFGWIEAFPSNALIKSCSQFKKIHFPLIILK